MSSLSCELYGDALVASFDGVIDRKAAPRLSAKLLKVLAPATHLVCDLTDVTDVTSAGYRLLLHAYHLTSAKRGEVAIVGAPEDIRDTMIATGLCDFFVMTDSLDEAIEQVCRDSYQSQVRTARC
ncbi:MAG: anti-sigma factor antagonist [Pirellulales bacterium]|nr:anti-sigma factor antagonist [Pirellulales bacterium]